MERQTLRGEILHLDRPTGMTTLQDMDCFEVIHNHLIKTYPPPLLPPSKLHSSNLTSQIASLQLHPTLEAALHIMNNDLAAAHFLVRHMQSPPAYEGMLLHGILHRIEGDFDNARCWYSDVAQSELYKRIWGTGRKTFKDLGGGIRDIKFANRNGYGKSGSKVDELDGGQRFLNVVQAFAEAKASTRDTQEENRLLGESRREIESVVEWCVERFGTGRWQDASGAWVDNNEDIQKMSDEQVNGDAGWRKF